MPSGTPETEEWYINEACIKYHSEVGKSFNWEYCVPILHKVAKFNPLMDDPDDEEAGSTNKKKTRNAVGVVMGSTLERPPGNKAAKAAKAAKTDAVTEMKVMYADVSSMLKNSSDSAKYDMLHSQRKHYYRIGEIVKAKELDKIIADLVKESYPSKVVASTTTTTTTTSTTTTTTPAANNHAPSSNVANASTRGVTPGHTEDDDEVDCHQLPKDDDSSDDDVATGGGGAARRLPPHPAAFFCIDRNIDPTAARHYQEENTDDEGEEYHHFEYE